MNTSVNVFQAVEIEIGSWLLLNKHKAIEQTTIIATYDICCE